MAEYYCPNEKCIVHEEPCPYCGATDLEVVA